jgi:putative transposase
VIDRQALHQLCGFSDYDQFAEEHRQWVHGVISGGRIQRDPCWTESIAVGSQNFIEATKSRLGFKAKGRRIESRPEELYVLREESVPYSVDFAPENEALSAENAFFWDDSRID